METQVRLPYKLRKRLLSSFIIIIVLMASLNLASLFWSGTYYKNLSGKLVQHVGIHRISMEFIAIPETLGNYISSGNSEYISQTLQRLDYVQEQLSILQASSEFRSMLYYQLSDAMNMVSTLKSQVNELVVNYVNGRPMIYIRDQENTIERHIGYIQAELSKVNSTYMEGIQEFYSGFSQTMGMVVRITIMITGILMLLSIIIARRFTLSISQPIHMLALTMLKFGKGDLDVVIEPVKTDDEISVLIDSFNNMSRRIRRLIHGIREKAEVEKLLKSQELVNLESQRLLRESELALLQSQINPHFLFNTLNTISAVAQIEEAPETESLISNLSTMLRYNLKNQNEMVRLEQEVEVVRSYMHIQRTRFGDKVSYVEKIDPTTLQELVPSMLLQPLVENAIKHGLEPVGRRGKVEMNIERTSEDALRIIIRDDGKGIEEDTIAKLYGTKPSGTEKPLGIYNVLRRLELCYGNRHLSIKKGYPTGTICTIEIPTRTVAVFNGVSDGTPEV